MTEPKREKAETVKVRFVAKSYRIKKGDEADVDKATADLLVENGHAVLVK